MKETEIKKYRIETSRMKQWDYRNPWCYYVTINSKDHKPWFGKITCYQMELNQIDKIAEECLRNIPKHLPISRNRLFHNYAKSHSFILKLNGSVETGHQPRQA